jgi:hypothetical protein
MGLPTYVIEIQFGSSGYVDVTSYAGNITISKGIARQLDDFSAGTLSITFTNNDRTFDPLNTSSILYYGAGGYTMVQPGGKIRVSANGIRRFTGFIQSWDFIYAEAGLDGQATVYALDEMFRVSNAVFKSSTEAQVQDTGSRIRDVMLNNGFDSSEYSLITYGKTIIGADAHAGGDNVLSYLQNVARSEPADLYANASAVMVMKDRSFANLSWTNTVRNNLIVYPGTATASIPTYDGTDSIGPYGVDGWTMGGRGSTVTALYGGTPNWATVNTYFSRYEMYYWEINPIKYTPYVTAAPYTYSFSTYLKGSALLSAQGGVSGYVNLLDVSGNPIQSNTFSATTATSSTAWKQFTVNNTYAGGSAVAGIQVRFYAGGTGAANYFYGDGWQFERAATLPNYFAGNYNPYTSSSTPYVSGSTVNSVAWSGTAYASFSGLVTSVATAISAPTIYTFADVNSQGTAYGNGTGIPFMEINVAYGGEQMYNKITVIGVNATAIATDSTAVTLYGQRQYTQADNLTTSTTQPQTIANSYLAAFKSPEYRAESIVVAVESLSSADQNRVLAIELRDVVRVAFQPSATGAVVAKKYEVLGFDSNADLERHHITFRLGSLDNLGLSF